MKIILASLVEHISNTKVPPATIKGHAHNVLGCNVYNFSLSQKQLLGILAFPRCLNLIANSCKDVLLGWIIET